MILVYWITMITLKLMLLIIFLDFYKVFNTVEHCFLFNDSNFWGFFVQNFVLRVEMCNISFIQTLQKGFHVIKDIQYHLFVSDVG